MSARGYLPGKGAPPLMAGQSSQNVNRVILTFLLVVVVVCVCVCSLGFVFLFASLVCWWLLLFFVVVFCLFVVVVLGDEAVLCVCVCVYVCVCVCVCVCCSPPRGEKVYPFDKIYYKKKLGRLRRCDLFGQVQTFQHS